MNLQPFKSARIKLTVWYLFIIMVISISFSLVIYRMIYFELLRVQLMHQLRIERRLPERLLPPAAEEGQPPSFYLDPDLIWETEHRLQLILVLINLGILGASAIAGYLLAGRTLKPIEQMLIEQNRFITDASHELRTPLTSLKTEIEVNLRDKKLSLSEAKKTLYSNLEEVNNLQALSDSLIKLTQFQNTDNGFSTTKISLAAVFNKAIKKVANLAKQKKITIINNINDFSAKANEAELIELLVILLDNAIKYSPKLTQIELFSKKTDGNIIFYIKDQGIGINDKDLPHIFDRFYRADKSRTKTNISGYGLGLSIAKQIVYKHNGHIKVISIAGKGTTVEVQLPVKQR